MLLTAQQTALRAALSGSSLTEARAGAWAVADRRRPHWAGATPHSRAGIIGSASNLASWPPACNTLADAEEQAPFKIA